MPPLRLTFDSGRLIVSDIATLIEIRLLAWLTLLTIAGVAAILWHAILTYDLFPDPFPPHPPRQLLMQTPSPSPTPRRSPENQATSNRPAMPVELAEPPSSRAVPLDVARARVRELGGLDRVAERLGITPRSARTLLASERPLPRWVLDTLFEDWEEDKRLRTP